MKKYKKSTLILSALLSSLFSTPSNASEYIVCKDVGNGGIKCEDGYYQQTGESADAVPVNQLKESLAQSPTFDGDKIVFKNSNLSDNTQKRITSFIEEIKEKSKNQGGIEGLTKEKLISLISQSNSLDSYRKSPLIKEIQESKEITSYSKPKDFLNQIARAKVMI